MSAVVPPGADPPVADPVADPVGADPAPFFLGTCRVSGPAEVLRRRGTEAFSSPHRLHTPMQTLQFAEHVAGRKAHFSPANVHLVSDFAMERVVAGDAATAWAKLQGLRESWRRATVFLVEISSLAECPVTRPDGSVLYANTFSARDLARHAGRLAALAAAGRLEAVPAPGTERLTGGRALAAMRRIKATLRGRPVIWLSHARPPPGDPAHEQVIAVRSHLARVLRDGAATLGDGFFDPSTVAEEMGPARFFAAAGTDLGHFTPEAEEALADRYAALAGQPAGGQGIA